MRVVRTVIPLFLIGLSALTSLLCQVTVSTAQYNNSRTGANLSETVLTTSNVNVNSFGKLFAWNVDGWVFAQPLYIPHVTIGSTAHNVVYIATMNNTIYAFDADTLSQTPLWTKNFGPPVKPLSFGNCPAYSTGELGILSTPVIDTSTNTMYFVTTTAGTGPQAGGYVFYMNAIDITTAQHKYDSPLLIQASVTGSGYDNVAGVVSLNNFSLAQRPAVTLGNGIVYVGFANCGPDIDPWHGWLLGWYKTWLGAHTNAWNSTPNGGEGGIWQSGRGFVVDSSGDLYLSTGNGSVGNQMFGSNIMKMNAWGGVLKWFTPGNWSLLDSADLDLSSTGPLQIPGSGLVVAGGKQGLVYLLPESTFSPLLQSFQASSPCGNINDGDCNEIHSMSYWGTPTNGTLYIWASTDNLRAFTFQNRLFNTTPSSQASILSDNTGASVAVSANGTAAGTGILWATNGASYPYANPIIPPTVYAFDAANLGHELWDSNQNVARDGVSGTVVTKWTTPTVANGKVFIPTFNSYNFKTWNVLVYGLLPK